MTTLKFLSGASWAFLIVAILFSWNVRFDGPSPYMVHFLDVDQGDAVLFQSPEGRNVLYDAGPPGQNLLNKLRARGADTLHLVILSHPHLDHIGGIPEIIDSIVVLRAMDNGMPHTTQTYMEVIQGFERNGVEMVEPGVDRRIQFGEKGEIRIVPPPGIRSMGLNNNSVGARFILDGGHVFMGGDAEEEEWEWWLNNYPSLLGPVAIHKASHHGSRNGDTREGIRELKPQWIVIGLGSDNRYGHPHRDALDLYEESGAEVFSTASHGNILFEIESDTARVLIEKVPPLEAPSGEENEERTHEDSDSEQSE